MTLPTPYILLFPYSIYHIMYIVYGLCTLPMYIYMLHLYLYIHIPYPLLDFSSKKEKNLLTDTARVSRKCQAQNRH